MQREPRAAFLPGLSRDVIARLVDDGQAQSVAEAAVAEAVARGARVRFVQVVDAGLTPEDQCRSDQATFGAALRALRGSRGIPCRFELVTGDPTGTLLELAEAASAIVVGAESGDGILVQQCRQHSDCQIVTVPVGAA